MSITDTINNLKDKLFNYGKAVIIVRSNQQRELAKRLIDELPEGYEIVFRKESKKRTKEQNSYSWAGMLGDFKRQGFVNGRQFKEMDWHEYLKKLFLPDHYIEGITLKGYRKWIELPDGTLHMVGSTTQLTVLGFSNYINECVAFGAQELGIMFTDIRNK